MYKVGLAVVLDSQANSNAVDKKATSGKFKAAGAKDDPARLEPKGLNNIETKINKILQVKESNTDMVANNIHDQEGPDPPMNSNKY